MQLRLDTYQPIYFDLRAKVAIDPDREWTAVEPVLRASLIAAFSFQARSFGQSVTLSEVVRVLQSVAGVVFVDVDTLRRFDQTAPELPAGDVLPALDVRWADDEAEPGLLAQLLIVNPFGIALTQA